MQTELFEFADGIAHYGEKTDVITQQLFNEVYKHRIKNIKGPNKVTGSNNVAATALVFTDGEKIIFSGTSRQTRSRLGEDNRNNHAERESLANAIWVAIELNKPPFNDLKDVLQSRDEIKELISLDALLERSKFTQLTPEQQTKQQALFEAMGSLSQIVTYSEREFCNFIDPGNEGCKTYLETLEKKCGKTGEWLGFYSISKDMRSECSKELLDRVTSKEIYRLAFSTDYELSEKEILCKAIFDKINKSISELNGIYARFGRVESRGVIPSHEQQQLTVISSQLIEQIHVDLADPRKTIELYKLKNTSTSTAPLSQKFAAVIEELATLPSQQPEQAALKSPLLEILEEIQSKINSFIEKYNHAFSQKIIFHFEIEVKAINDKLQGWNEKIKPVLQSLKAEGKVLEQQLKRADNAEHRQRISNTFEGIKHQWQNLNEFCNKDLKSLYDDLQKLPKLTDLELKECKDRIYRKLTELKQSTPEKMHLFVPATPTEPIFPNSGGVGVSELLDSELQDPELEQAKVASLQSAKNEGTIGSRSIGEWKLQDVEDKGNCFYDAVVHQIQSLPTNQQNREISTFLSTVPTETLHRDRLRLNIQGRAFKDGEWADIIEIEQFARNFNAVVAIVDTRGDIHNFIYHYINEDGGYRYTENIEDPALSNKPIIKLAFTGNHYMSVMSYPLNLQSGSTTSAASEATQEPQAQYDEQTQEQIQQYAQNSGIPLNTDGNTLQLPKPKALTKEVTPQLPKPESEQHTKPRHKR